MNASLDHIHFYCGDIEKTVAYFRDVFSGKELSREKRPNSVLVRIEIQGATIALMAVPQESGQFDTGKGKRGLDHIGFKVKDLQAALEEVKAKGVRITQELTVLPSGLKMAFVEGPDGIRIELLERS